MKSKGDNITSIVKSLKPIDYLYSKESKDYERYFRSSSLKQLIQNLKSTHKFNEFLNPGETLDDLRSTETNFMNVNFKNTFNYLDELSNLKNLSMKILNKNRNKKGKLVFKSIEESLMNYQKQKLKEEEKKEQKVLKEQKEKEKEKEKKKLQKILHLRHNADAEVTLDPGRYHPNYNYIKRRCPCAYLGKPRVKKFVEDEQKITENSEKENNTNEEFEENDDFDSNNSNNSFEEYNKKNDKIIFMKNLKNNDKKNNNKILFSTSKNFNNNNSSNKLNKNKIQKISHKIKKSINNKRNNNHQKQSFTQYIILQKNNSDILISTRNENINNEFTNNNFHKKMNISALNNIRNNSVFTKTSFSVLPKINDSSKLKIKKYSNNNPADSMRCTISFNKMPGRDRKINVVDCASEGCSTYEPSYAAIRPHVPSTIFKCKRKSQDYKKYITGKIIRSYFFSPGNYFVMNYKKKDENDIGGDYNNIIMKSKGNISD